MSARTIREIEAGRSRPQAGTVRVIAEALELTADDLAALLLDRRFEPGVPRALPPAPARFAGRHRELSILEGAVKDGATLLVLSGSGGLGKTWLALHWAHASAGDFPDGLLFVGLRGFDATGSVVEPAEAVRGLLGALNVPPQQIPAEPDAQVALYRKLVADKRMLIVLDDARDAAQVRPLLPQEPQCLVVVTSRNALTGLTVTDGARPVPVALLDTAEARALLTARLGAEAVAREAEAVDAIVHGCAGLPLALAIVVAQALNAPVPPPDRATAVPGPLAQIAEGLRSERDRLSALSTQDPQTEPRSVFSWSYEALSAQAARLFRLLGLHPGPQVSVAAAASLSGEPKSRTRTRLAELAAANLVHESAPGRFGMHDLLRAYAAELAETDEEGNDREAARSRMLDHYLHSGYAAARIFNPARRLITMDSPEPGTVAVEFGDKDEALRWFVAEHATMLSVIGYAANGQHDAATWQTSWTITDFLDRHGHWHELAAIQLSSLDAARRLGDSSVEFLTHHNLAHAYMRLERLDSARTHLLSCLELNIGDGDRPGQAHIHRALAIVAEKDGELEEALEHADHALRLFEESDDPLGHARALNAVGWLRSRLGDLDAALIACREALALHQDLGHAPGQAATWDSLGHIHRGLGDFEEAVACHRNALRLVREIDDRYNEADILNALGDTHRAAGDPAAARQAWRQALDILTDLDHPDAEAVRAKLDGRD